MDDPPRPVNRRLPLLGAALIICGIIGLFFDPGWDLSFYIPQIGLCFVVTLAGLSAYWLSRREASVRAANLFLWSSLLAIFVTLVFGTVEMFQQMSNLRSYGLFAMIQTLLMYLGAPVLWGAARARRENPGSFPPQKAGRLSAGVVQLGFFFLFAAEAHRFAQFQFTEVMGSSVSAALFALLQLTDLAERILLLWASIESVRTAVDDEVILRRAVRINRLLEGWLLLGALSGILGNVRQYLSDSSGAVPSAAYVWRSGILVLLTFAAALAVANRLTVRSGAPKSVISGNPSTGAEA